jgi:hypothetical protein
MLKTRMFYASFTVFLVALNTTALWVASSDTHETNKIVPMALIINAVAWPLALVITYRIGQATGFEYLRKIRAKAGRIRASRTPR